MPRTDTVPLGSDRI